MYHASHIVVSVLVCITIFEHGSAAKTPDLTDDFLSMLASQFGSLLGPNLSPQIDRRINNNTETTTPTTIPATTSRIITKSQRKSSLAPTASTLDKKIRTTTAPTTTSTDKSKPTVKLFDIVQDSARAPQTQLENQFPFDFRNNYQNYPGAGSSQGVGRQFNGPLFGGRDSFNPESFRPFNSQLNGDRAGENNGAIDPRFPSGRESIFNGGVNTRPFDSPDSSSEFDRYQQNFGRLGFNGRNPNSNRFFDPGFRSDGQERFTNFNGQLPLDRNNLLPNNYRQDLRANYQNSVGNDQGQGFQSFLGSNQQYAQNFDVLPTQRIQNLFADEFQRNQLQQQQQQLLQQQQQQSRSGSANFSPYFGAPVNNVGSPVGAPVSSIANVNGEKDNGIAPGPLSSVTRRFGENEKALGINEKKAILDKSAPKIQQARDELLNILYPLLDDYSDVRGRGDTFKPTPVSSNIEPKKQKINKAFM